MISRNQLTFDIMYIINSFNHNGDIRKFHKRVIKYDKHISVYIDGDLYKDFKKDTNKIYDNIINGDEDNTFINDYIHNLDSITYQLLIFE